MKKIVLTAGLAVIICISSLAQNYISGIVSLHGDNTASGTTTVANGASLYLYKNKLYEQGGFINQGDSAAISADSGMLVFNGKSAQTITGRFKIGALELTNTKGATINNDEPVTMVTILDSVSFGSISNSVFNAGDGLMTLRSTNLKTARIADLTHNNANTGNKVSGRVIAERYVRSRRTWHLLSPPTTADSSNDQTIQEAWQEGARAPRGQVVDPNPGYGTVITRPGSNPVSATGYDDGVAGATAYSMRTYQSNGWLTQPANTDLTHFSSHAAYFLFVRGDRSVAPDAQTSTNQTQPTVTTLRSKGALHNGTVTNVIATLSGQFAGVANPYACTIDFSTVTMIGMVNGFYTWDPSINVYGGWVYIDGDDNYNSTPLTPGGVGVYTNPATNALIQSGQGIVVRPLALAGTIIFKEKDKNITSRVEAFRQVPMPALYVSLFSKDSSHTFLDGTTSLFDASFSKSVLPAEDIKKPGNTNENLSFYNDSNYLMKERWPLPAAGDTLPLRLWRTSAKKYSFEITEKYFEGAPQAYLLDRYLQTSSPVTAGSPATFDFDITSDAASKAIDRFAIVFGSAAVLPVTLTQIKAEWDGTQVNVRWNVQNETGIVSYEVEKSTNGASFTKAGTVTAHKDAAATDAYSFPDNDPAEGDNFYRIKMINQNGSYTYTNIVTVLVPPGNLIIAVRPNPVTNGLMKLWFEHVKAGMYQVQVYSMDGKTVLSKKLSHPGGTVTYTLPAGMLAQGLYHAVIRNTSSGNVIADIPVMIE